MLSEFIKDKAREIAYALVRISYYIKRPDLRSRIESLTFELLENSARTSANSDLSNLNRSLENISALDSLVRLGHSIYEIEPINATILVRELDNLNSAIRQFGNEHGKNENELPDLETIFKAKLDKERGGQQRENIQNVSGNNNGNGINTAIRSRQDVGISTSLSEVFNDASGQSAEGKNSAIGVAIRQSAIINKIKSLPAGRQEANGSGCRLKDLLAEFPDVSERTIRYDLQRLCEQGVIERVGNGGPASYYRLADNGLSEAAIKPLAVSQFN